MVRKIIIAVVLVLLVAGSITGYLFLAPARATISVADAPPEPYNSSIQAIYITFGRIEVHAANAGNESGWHALTTEATVDLLKTVNASKLLGSAQLPMGKYTEVRFFANNATVKINGVNVTYTIPSGSQTGIKVKIEGGGFQLYGGQTMSILLDIAFQNSEIFNNPNRTLVPVASARIV